MCVSMIRVKWLAYSQVEWWSAYILKMVGCVYLYIYIWELYHPVTKTLLGDDDDFYEISDILRHFHGFLSSY